MAKKNAPQPFSSLKAARDGIVAIKKDIDENQKSRNTVMKKIAELAKQAGTDTSKDAELGKQYRESKGVLDRLTKERRELGVELRKAEKCVLHFLDVDHDTPLLDATIGKVGEGKVVEAKPEPKKPVVASDDDDDDEMMEGDTC